MSEIDTSTAAVQRLALSLAIANQPVTAATLTALAGERDAWQGMAVDAAQRLMLAETEGDAARADAARLRGALLGLEGANNAMAHALTSSAYNALTDNVPGINDLRIALDDARRAARAALGQESAT